MILRCWMAVLGLLACHVAVGAESLFGKVMCGYQGWFATPADGEGMGWRHYGFDKQGQCHIDLWPDVSELDADERVDTPLKFADGSTAQVFRSAHPKTVRRGTLPGCVSMVWMACFCSDSAACCAMRGRESMPTRCWQPCGVRRKPRGVRGA